MAKKQIKRMLVGVDEVGRDYSRQFLKTQVRAAGRPFGKLRHRRLRHSALGAGAKIRVGVTAARP
jgi:hypothetical protein